MKNSVIAFVTIFILHFTIGVYGQGDASLNKGLKLNHIHQIDYLSMEMISMFRIMMEKPSVLNGLNEKAASETIISFDDIIFNRNNNSSFLSQMNTSEKYNWQIKKSINKTGEFQNNIRIYEMPIMSLPTISLMHEVDGVEANPELGNLLPTATSELAGWKFKFGARDGFNF
jgi:hypothetical protein